jgi:hypothetical protein
MEEKTTRLFRVLKATEKHAGYAQLICDEMASSARVRGTGIAKRSPELLIQKMQEGKAVIAFSEEGKWAGFCYIESWENDKYVSNSGLIVAPEFRQHGLARAIKKKILKLSREKFPEAFIFGLTTSSAVMKINSALGYEPVAYPEITSDEKFWEGCKSCVNYEVLLSKNKKNCFCTAMLFDKVKTKKNSKNQLKEQAA